MKLLTLIISICLFVSCKQNKQNSFATNSSFYFNDSTPNKIDTLRKYLIGEWQLQAWLYTEDNKNFYCNPYEYNSVKELSDLFDVSIDSSFFTHIEHYVDTSKWSVDTTFYNLIQERMKNPNENLINNITKREIRFYETGEQIVSAQTKNDLAPFVRSIGRYKLLANGDIYEQAIFKNGISDTIDHTAATKVNMFGKNCLLVSTLFDTVSVKDYDVSSEHFIRFYKRKQ